MKIYELFEDVPGLPGLPGQPSLLAIPAIPTTLNNATAINKIGTANTSATVPATVSSTQPIGTPPTASGNQSTTSNVAQPAQPITPPQINKGVLINVPVGPSKIKTSLKINSVDSSNKTATLVNPLKPNDSGITYKQADLAAWLVNNPNK